MLPIPTLDPASSDSVILPSLLTSAVQVFDGSSVSEPMVVSTAYWVNLKAQLLTLLLGQLCSVVILAIVASITVQQSPQIATQVRNELEKTITPTLKVPPPTQTGSDDDSSPPLQIDVPKLFTCLGLDVLGSASELIPLWGALADVVYAPLAAFVLRNQFGGSNVAFVIELAEEILPFTDALPFCTICWVIDTFAADSDLARVLQLGQYTPQSKDKNAVIGDNEDMER